MDTQDDDRITIPAPAPEYEMGLRGTTVFYSRTEAWLHIVMLDAEVGGNEPEFLTRNAIEPFTEDRLAHWKSIAHMTPHSVRVFACVDIAAV